VISYLNEENDYYEKMTAHTADLKESLFEEIKGRLKDDEWFISVQWVLVYY
jgi:oligopeptidase B